MVTVGTCEMFIMDGFANVALITNQSQTLKEDMISVILSLLLLLNLLRLWGNRVFF